MQKGTAGKHALWRRLLAMMGVALMVVSAFAASGIVRPAYAADADAAASTQEVKTGTTNWQYRDDNVRPGADWTTSEAVTDAAWKTAAGSFGAKNGQIADLGGGYTPQNLLNQYIVGGANDGNDIPVYYFRTTFDVADPASVTKIAGEVAYDDAAIVAINGHVVGEFDNHVKDGTDPIYGTDNYGGSNDSAPLTGTISYYDVANLGLKTTDNVLSVEVHNGRATSSDVYFDMKGLWVVNGTGATDPTTPAKAEVKDVFLGIGATESERGFSWLGTSSNKTSVQYVVAPQGYKAGDAFPADAAGVKTVEATQAAAQREGFNSNKATVSGLAANTTYVYRVGNDDAWSDAYAFTTGAFGANSEFSFLMAGDPQIGASGNTGSDAEGWYNMMAATQKQLSGADFLFSMGDQINNYDGNKTDAEYDAYLAPDALRTMTTASEVGNHDEGNHAAANSRYSDYFINPNVSGLGATQGAGAQGGDYWFTYNGVLFMSLNSNNTSTAEHKAFMQQAIAANPNATWKVASFHHSTYSVANHYTDGDIVQRRQELSPVFSELGVDAVLMGHDHHYTRTYLMDGQTPVIPAGNDVSKGEPAPTEQTAEAGQVFYLTADSASGSKFYKLNKTLAQGLPTFSAVDWQQNMPSITDVKVTSDAMMFTSYYQDADGSLKQFDQFTLKKAKKNNADSGEQGGNTGNQGGNTGNQGGNAGSDNQDNTGSGNQGGSNNGNNAGQNNNAKKSNTKANGKSNLPKTGDTTTLTFASVAAVAAVVLGVGMYLHRRRG